MKKKFQSGFTLVELMVTLSVAAIVLMFGVPSFQEVVQNNRLLTQANDLTAALNLARSEAVKRSTNVSVCVRNSAGTACNSSGAWEDGWLVFTDIDDDGALDDDGDSNLCEADDDDCLLKIYDPLTGGNTLSFRDDRKRVTFDSRGYAVGFNGTFIFCDSRGTGSLRAKALHGTGRLRSVSESDADFADLSCG